MLFLMTCQNNKCETGKHGRPFHYLDNFCGNVTVFLIMACYSGIFLLVGVTLTGEQTMLDLKI